MWEPGVTTHLILVRTNSLVILSCVGLILANWSFMLAHSSGHTSPHGEDAVRLRFRQLGPSAFVSVRLACAIGAYECRPHVLHGKRDGRRTKSDKKGRFVSEEEHEWYEEDWDDEQEKRIWAGCMRRHRLNLLEYASTHPHVQRALLSSLLTHGGDGGCGVV
jgi:hypothetical protein